MNDRVTVVTVCLNAARDLESTINSVYSQNYCDMEYIIKDGKSTDNTDEIVKKFIPLFNEKGVKMQYISSQDTGIYDAMNQAVKLCSDGDSWVIFMNAGDMFYNNTVLNEIFENRDWSKSDVIYGHTLFRLSKNRGMIVNHDADRLKDGWSLSHQSVFVRESILKCYPFDCSYKMVADYNQMLELTDNGYTFTKVNAIISDVNREGFSNINIKCRYKENNSLKNKYNLNFKQKSLLLGEIKQLVRRVIPRLERYFCVKNSQKRIMLFK